jgi:intein/homing endonuclease
MFQGDLSQIELRLIAAACGDEAMVNAYRNDIDLHSLTHSLIFKRPYEECLKDHVAKLQKAGKTDLAKKLELERKISKCVDPDTLVSVNGRIARIGDLHDGREEDTFYRLDGQIQGHTGLVPLRHFYSNGIKKRLLICTKRGIISCSEEHPLLMHDGTLKKAKDIRVNDPVAELCSMPSGNDSPEVPFNPVRLSPVSGLFKVDVNNDLAYLLGLFYGDGESDAGGVGVCFGGKPEFFDWQDIVVESIEKCGFETKLNRTNWDSDVDGPKVIKSGPCKGTVVNGSCGNVVFGSTRVQDIFIQLGAVTHDRHRSLKIPTWLFNAKKEIKIQFLAGWFDTDGSALRQGSLCGLTKSWIFAQDICVLMSSIGMKFSIKPGWNKPYKKWYYRITVNLEHTWEFFNGKLRHPKKKALLRPSRQKVAQKPNLCTTIIPLEPGHVVDVEVNTDEHMFVANGLAQRNTSNFLTGYGGGATGLQSNLAGDSIYYTIAECEKFLNDFFDSYPTLRTYLSYYKRFIADHGVAVSILGRVRAFEEVFSDDKKAFNKALRAGCNHLIQATASDMMLIALCAIEAQMRDAGLESILVSTVHDSLLIDSVRDEVPMINEIVSRTFSNMPTLLDLWFEGNVDLSWLIIPIGGDCEIGRNALDMVKIDGSNPDWDKLFRMVDEEKSAAE